MIWQYGETIKRLHLVRSSIQEAVCLALHKLLTRSELASDPVDTELGNFFELGQSSAGNEQFKCSFPSYVHKDRTDSRVGYSLELVDSLKPV